MNEHVFDRICDFFKISRDFNGILLLMLMKEFNLPWPELRSIITDLLQKEEITLSFASHQENPHIKRLPDLSIDLQINRLVKDSPDSICAYPSPKSALRCIKLSDYEKRTFTQRLALVEPQLTPVFFDFEVLENYHRDPRYIFKFHDFAGSIEISDEYYESSSTAIKDKIFLQTFGVGYDNERNRVVVVYLRYLSKLSPEHQQIWDASSVPGPCTVNSDYEGASILGNWPKYYSAYEAFLVEQFEINRLSEIIGKPRLFLKTFEKGRPEGFSAMFRPTQANYYEFIHLLDKLLSENINQDFFRGDVELENRIQREDGTIEIKQKGRIMLLEDWLRNNYRDANGEDVSNEMVAPLKKVRKIRQTPAHKISKNAYDKSYPNEQSALLEELVLTLQKIRLILWSHPNARDNYSPPGWLDSDKIVFY